MTESEWLASEDPAAMLSHLFSRHDGGRRPSGRKCRLFALAVARTDPQWPRWSASSPPKRYAAAVEDALEQGRADYDFSDREARDYGLWFAVRSASEAAELMAQQSPGRVAAALLREIVGNPLRPVTLDPAWLTPTVLALAASAYEERDDDGTLDTLTLLAVADALEEAGCDTAECDECEGTGCGVDREPGCDCCFRCHGNRRVTHPLLAHLRAPGPHVRGCWVLDLILGRG